MTIIRLNPAPTFEGEVKIRVPGVLEAQDTRFTFRTLDQGLLVLILMAIGLGGARASWWRALWARVRLHWHLKRLASMVDVFDLLIESWDGFDQPYSKPALRQLLIEFPGAGSQIMTAYLTHRQEARIKN